MIVKIPKEYESKFRFINVAAQRANQLQAGARGKVCRGSKPATIAIREAEGNLINFKILEVVSEEAALQTA